MNESQVKQVVKEMFMEGEIKIELYGRYGHLLILEVQDENGYSLCHTKVDLNGTEY